MQNKQILSQQLNFYWERYQQNQLSKGDVVGIFLVLYDQLFQTSNWLQTNSNREHTTKQIQSTFFPKQTLEFAGHNFFRKAEESHSLGNIFNQSVFKKETLRSCYGLMHVFSEPETIKILDYIPKPIEVLELQTQGLRCVTLLREDKWFYHRFDHNRNIRDFVIHDLEHIWQLFENPELTLSQVEFSKKLLELTIAGEFEFLRTDNNFSREFDYIISDMNTHPAHTYATLKSLIARQKTKSDIELKNIMQHFDGLVPGQSLKQPKFHEFS